MQNMPNLSSRAAKALEILSEGGRFVERLETNSYTGRSQFKHRCCYGRTSTAAKGIGHAAFHELKTAGFLTYCPDEGTSVSSYWKINRAA